jgi:hypothetical protein|tara:strand:+ start:35660 stop:35845 length:186 start_codon:yes stop_codon:yes gene_type:complete
MSNFVLALEGVTKQKLLKPVAQLVANKRGLRLQLNLVVCNPGGDLLQPGEGQGAVEQRMAG